MYTIEVSNEGYDSFLHIMNQLEGIHITFPDDQDIPGTFRIRGVIHGTDHVTLQEVDENGEPIDYPNDFPVAFFEKRTVYIH